MELADKQIVLRQKLRTYEATIYDAEVECKIAERLDDDEGLEAQKQRMIRIQKALDYINEELKKLTNGD